jgi:S-ribosylhomocysteine lyase LuxS involved in autoinducer biosynthesis
MERADCLRSAQVWFRAAVKIRFTKANGTSMELSDIHRVELINAGLVKICRKDHFGIPELSFEFAPNGAGTGIYVYDVNIPWPGPFTAIA